MERILWTVPLLLLAGCGVQEPAPFPEAVPPVQSVAFTVHSVEQVAYEQGLLLAYRSQQVHETLKPAVVREIAGLVALSKQRHLTEPERARLSGLDALRKAADDWVRIHNAYLDILGAIEYFQEKPDRDDRDEKRLAQLLAGLPRNNLSLERAMQGVTLAARNMGLKMEAF